MIMFSQELIGKAESDVGKFGKNNDSSDFGLLEVKSLDASQVASLVEKCNAENYGQSLNTKTCYIVRSDVPFNISRGDVASKLSSQDMLAESFDAQGKTIYVVWDSLAAKVVVKT
ncbi:MAG: hypothetical protein QXZ13_02425 [Candidatus Diapherotrites archaeon]